MDVNATISSAAGILGSLTLTGILSALLTLAVCLVFKKIIMKLFTKAFSKTKLDTQLIKITTKVIETILWVVIILILCETLGIKLTSLLALFSVVGLAFSLALQDSLSNLASGIMLLAGHPFKLGDYVEVGGQEGTVKNMGIIHTLLATPDNKLIYVPNSSISSSKIVNYSTEDVRRVDFTVTASYDATTTQVRAAVLEAVETVPGIHKDPAPMVVISEYGPSTITYSIRVWTKNEIFWTVNFALKEAVRESFLKNGIAMIANRVSVTMVKE